MTQALTDSVSVNSTSVVYETRSTNLSASVTYNGSQRQPAGSPSRWMAACPLQPLAPAQALRWYAAPAVDVALAAGSHTIKATEAADATTQQQRLAREH